MPMLQVDIRCEPLHWQSEAHLYEIDLEELAQRLNYWMSDILRYEHKDTGVAVFDIKVRRYK
jgi:hypothetical protein